MYSVCTTTRHLVVVVVTTSEALIPTPPNAQPTTRLRLASRSRPILSYPEPYYPTIIIRPPVPSSYKVDRMQVVPIPSGTIVVILSPAFKFLPSGHMAAMIRHVDVVLPFAIPYLALSLSLSLSLYLYLYLYLSLYVCVCVCASCRVKFINYFCYVSSSSSFLIYRAMVY